MSYFGPVVIKINQPVVEFNVTTYPNPFMNTVEVNVTNSQPGVMHIVLHDLQGKVVAEKEVNVEKGISNITIDNLEGLNNGFYFMNVTLNGNAYRQKLVKTGN